MPIKVFFDLCLLRATPQDLPASVVLLGATLATYTLVSLAFAVADLSLKHAIFYALADALLLAMLTHTALVLRRFRARLIQTLSALAGSGTLLGLSAWPLNSFSEPPLLPLLALLLWSVAVTAHILRHALAVPLAVGVAVSLSYLAIAFTVMSTLFPSAQGL